MGMAPARKEGDISTALFPEPAEPFKFSYAPLFEKVDKRPKPSSLLRKLLTPYKGIKK